MLVTCLMPTFNRPGAGGLHLLGHAVQSFLDQDHPDKELLVGNDTPGQRLACDAPGVRVVNFPERFDSLGAKLAAMVEIAGGGLLCRWDDDDWSLPWRLSLSAERLGERLEWRPSNYWWFQSHVPSELREVTRPGNTHVMALWRREVLGVIGGYPLTTGDEDQQFNQRLHVAGLGSIGGAGDLSVDEIFYVYRWGVSRRHLSSNGGTREELDGQYSRIGAEDVPQGEFRIEPQRWVPPITRIAR